MKIQTTPSKPVGQSLRFKLRAGTADAHGKLDSLLIYFDTLEGYRRYLTGQYIFRKSIEERLLTAADNSSDIGGWKPPVLINAICLDMTDLHVAKPDTEFSKNFRLSSDKSTLLGSLYVLEGSNIGARLLFRKAQELGLTSEFGARHLSIQSIETNRWANFLNLLESSEINTGAAIAAANKTFETALRAFAGLK